MKFLKTTLSALMLFFSLTPGARASSILPYISIGIGLGTHQNKLMVIPKISLGLLTGLESANTSFYLNLTAGSGGVVGNKKPGDLKSFSYLEGQIGLGLINTLAPSAGLGFGRAWIRRQGEARVQACPKTTVFFGMPALFLEIHTLKTAVRKEKFGALLFNLPLPLNGDYFDL